jgi:hypothetical protein
MATDEEMDLAQLVGIFLQLIENICLKVVLRFYHKQIID